MNFDNLQLYKYLLFLNATVSIFMMPDGLTLATANVS